MRNRTALPIALVLAASPVLAQHIAVGRNVQVSSAHENDTHYEVLVAADPNNASRLVVGSFRYPAGTMESGTVVYASRDGGKTWQPTLKGDVLANTSDPAPAYGPDGTAYYTASSLGPAGTPREARKMLLFRSSDGGMAWEGPTQFTYSDRQYITVDATGGKYHGRLYVNGNNRVPYGISDFVVFRSLDKGTTWQGPGTREGFGKHSAGMMGNAVIASDGTLIGLFEEKDNLRAITSVDGGASLTPAVDIDTGYVEAGNRKGTNNNVTTLPIIAIDAGKGPRRDNVYAVWADRRTGRGRIFLASSSDKGRTWSKSRPIDDSPATDSSDNFMPSVAVNNDGVVGVMWYDRREHADNIGWDVRFTASSDGGKTFLPSAMVSERGTTFGEKARYTSLRASSARPAAAVGGVTVLLTLNNFVFLGGDTAGLVADATGVFHPVWVDSRTGIPQVWTAPVGVGRKAPQIRAGSDDRSPSVDVSDRVMIDVVDATFDRGSRTVSAAVQLRNTSQVAVRGPFTVRLREITSDIGELRAADNDWTFSNLALEPGAVSSPKTWTFVISGIQPFRSGNRYRTGLVKLNAVVLGSPVTPSQRP